MSRAVRRWLWLATTGVVAFGCGANRLTVAIDPATTQPGVSAQDVPVRGSWLRGEVRDTSGRPLEFAGELIALSDPATATASPLLVLGVPEQDHVALMTLPTAAVTSLRIVDHVRWPIWWEGGAGVAGALLSVPANGFVSVFTAPLWLVGGTALAIYHAKATDVVVAPGDLLQLRSLARFPAGLPAGVTGLTAK